MHFSDISVGCLFEIHICAEKSGDLGRTGWRAQHGANGSVCAAPPLAPPKHFGHNWTKIRPLGSRHGDPPSCGV